MASPCSMTREKEARKAMRERLDGILSAAQTPQAATEEGYQAVTTGFSIYYIHEIEQFFRVLADLKPVAHLVVKTGRNTIEVWRPKKAMNPFRS